MSASTFSNSGSTWQVPSLITIDLDGTLVDSIGDLHASVNQMQQKLAGPERSEQQVRRWVGNGADRLVHRALTNSMETDAPPDEFARAINYFRLAYQSINGKYSHLYPGVLSTLGILRDTQCRLICVTTKPAQFTRPLLEVLQIYDYFELILSGDDLPLKKPHPLPLLHAAEFASTIAQNCLHVGDSNSDIKAARSAGFQIACVSYGYNHGIDVHSLQGDLKPDVVLDSFDQLPELWR